MDFDDFQFFDAKDPPHPEDVDPRPTETMRREMLMDEWDWDPWGYEDWHDWSIFNKW